MVGVKGFAVCNILLVGLGGGCWRSFRFPCFALVRISLDGLGWGGFEPWLFSGVNLEPVALVDMLSAQLEDWAHEGCCSLSVYGSEHYFWGLVLPLFNPQNREGICEDVASMDPVGARDTMPSW